MRKRRHSTVTKEKATRYTKKIINLFTWFQYGRMAHKIYLWISDNKDIIYDTLQSITEWVSSYLQNIVFCL